jgi:hypothetical protein
MFRFNTTKRILLGISITISVALFGGYLYARNSGVPTENQSLTVTSTSDNPYDPAQYGVPNTLGGYKVLAIMTVRDVPCISPLQKNILLQATENTVQDYLKDPRPLPDLPKYLNSLPGEANTIWQMGIVGPGLTLEKLKINMAKMQASMAGKPCPPPTGGPIKIATPS